MVDFFVVVGAIAAIIGILPALGLNIQVFNRKALAMSEQLGSDVLVNPIPKWRWWLTFGVATLALTGAIFNYAKATSEFKVLPRNKLELIEGKSFANESVEMDGKLFRECDFTNVTLIFHGTANAAFEHTGFHQPLIIKTDNQAAREFAGFIVHMQLLGGVVDKDKVGFDPQGDVVIQNGTGGKGNFGGSYN
jgi:hypothetical protein